MAYVTWQDAWEHLDKQVFIEGDLNITKLEALCSDASDNFDNRLRLRYTVPFTLAVNPDAYRMAQKVTSRWAAAQYLRNQQQSEGTDEQLWYAAQLEREAGDFMASFEARKAPEDAVVNASGLVFSATDGLADTELAENLPIFSRSRLVSGSGKHW